MRDHRVDRRRFLQQTGSAALSAAGWLSGDLTAQVTLPDPAGTAPPTLKAPPGACDCHHHIYDAVRFPPPPESGNPMQPNARVEEYELVKRRLRVSRSIVVTPAPYLTDNRVTLDAISRFGPSARGVAVIRPDVTDTQLRELHRGGIRGIRFSLARSRALLHPVTTIEMIEPLSRRIAPLGWHVQINLDANGIADAEGLWTRLPSPIVFDHIGHIPGAAGTRHPAYAVMRRMIDRGLTWVKLSVTSDNSADGPPGYADVVRLGQAFVAAAPERLVWGSNWPHPAETTKPDDAALLDVMSKWAADERTRHRILVENPAALYGFQV
jgi:D-galactarolactone isomerase